MTAKSLVCLALIAASTLAQVNTTAPPCPLLGHLYTKPKNYSSDPIWRAASVNLTNTLAKLPGLNETSFALQIVQGNKTKPVYEYYHKAPVHLHGSTGNSSLDGDTVFRVGSVSKLLTVYGLLVECGFKCFDDPITKYVPELKSAAFRDAINSVQWDEITLGSLASQMAGISRDYALGDLTQTFPMDILLGAGLPPIAPNTPNCSSAPSQPGCSRAESLALILSQDPMLPVYSTPAYSNIGFQLLGYALENITNLSYADAMAQKVFTPIGMKSTSVALPRNASEGVRLPDDADWRWDIGDYASAGAIYASMNDISKLLRAIVSHKQLSPTEARRWLKPDSWLAGTNYESAGIGKPWEVARIQGDNPNVFMDVYAKSGGLGGYTSQAGVLPDFDVSFSIGVLGTTAFGASTLQTIILDAITEPLSRIAKQQELRAYGGTYILTNRMLNSSLTIAADNDIGLIVQSWTSNATDLLSTLRVTGLSVGLPRIYPTYLRVESGDGTAKEQFRIIFQAAGPPSCLEWSRVGALRYGTVPLDELIFYTGSDGKAVAVEIPALKTKLEKRAS